MDKVKKRERKRKERERERETKSKRDTCVSGVIQREGEISISNRQQDAEGKLDLRRGHGVPRLKGKEIQSGGAGVACLAVSGQRIYRPGGGRRNRRKRNVSLPNLAASHLSKIPRLSWILETRRKERVSLPFSFRKRSPRVPFNLQDS